MPRTAVPDNAAATPAAGDGRTAPGEEALHLSGVSISLGERGGRPILRGIDLAVRRGEFLCIVGRNGAGKSTLCKCVAGIHTGYAGEIRIAGRPVRGIPARERARLVAYVPQSAPTDIPYTVDEFLDMARYPWRNIASRAEDARAVRAAAELADIAHLADRKLASLSGGERQKVLIAAAIAQEAACVLMDEPTTYLDYAHQVEAMQILSRVRRERGATMLLVTHDVNMALLLSDTVVALADGCVAWSGAPDAMTDPALLERIFGIPFARYVAPGATPPAMVAPVARL